MITKQFIFIIKLTTFLICLFGCGDDGVVGHSENNISSTSNLSVDVVKILTTPTGKSDLSVLLSDDNLSKSSVDNNQLAEFYSEKPLYIEKDLLVELPNSEVDQNSTVLIPIVEIEDSPIRSIDSFNQLENENAAKDAIISSLKELNTDLLDEIKFLREYQGSNYKEFQVNQVLLDPNKTTPSQEEDLRNKVKIQENRIDELLLENKNLEQKVLELTQNPYSKIRLKKPTYQPPQELSLNTDLSQSPLRANADLHFDAVVTSINGKNKEAFYTEFFILTTDLESLLMNTDLQLSDYSKIDSYSELWARSRKNPFLYPGVQKKIRTYLLNEVNLGNGKRIRSDIDGAAVISGIEEGSYYVIGSAALGKIGVTWNTPINISSGLNKLSLTLANSSWSL